MSGTIQRSGSATLIPLHAPRAAGGAALGARLCVPGDDAAEESAPAQPLSMHVNFSWVFLGNVVYAVSRWAMIVVLAHLGSTETVGLVVLAFALGAPLYSLANLGLRAALVTDARHQFAFQDYLGLRLVASVLYVSLVGTMVNVLGYDGHLVWITMLAAVGKLFESISDIFHGLLQRQERMDRIAIALIVREPAAVVFLAVTVYLTGNVVWGMLGFPAAIAATLFLYDIPNGARVLKASAAGAAVPGGAWPSDRLVPRWQARTLLRLLWLCVPLGVVMMIVTLLVNIPRYAVEHYLGAEALGVFASIAYISTAASTLVTALGQSASPRLAKHYAAGNGAAYCALVARLLVLVAVLGSGVALLMVVAGGPILRLLYGAQLAGYGSLAVWLMSAAALSNLCGPLGRAVDASRQFWTHMVIRIAGVLLLLAVLPGLVQGYGLEGAATAIFVSTGLVTLLYVGAVGAALVRLRRRRDWGSGTGHLASGDSPEAD